VTASCYTWSVRHSGLCWGWERWFFLVFCCGCWVRPSKSSYRVVLECSWSSSLMTSSQLCLVSPSLHVRLVKLSCSCSHNNNCFTDRTIASELYTKMTFSRKIVNWCTMVSFVALVRLLCLFLCKITRELWSDTEMKSFRVKSILLSVRAIHQSW